MPEFIDFLTALFASGDMGKVILLTIFILGILFFFLDIWGSASAKKRSPEDYLYGRLRDSYIHYWHQWRSEGLLDDEILNQKRLVGAGLDWILETCISHNIREESKSNDIRFECSNIKQVVDAWAGYMKILWRTNISSRR